MKMDRSMRWPQPTLSLTEQAERLESTPQLAIFVYGSLMAGQKNHNHFCGDAIQIQPAATIGRLYALPAGYPAMEVPEHHILTHSTADPLADAATQDRFGPTLGCRTKSIRPADDWGWVHGEFITFADPVRALPPMDRLEGFRPGQRSSNYQRVLVPIWAGDRIHCAWAYVMTAGMGHQFLPQGSWPPISGGL